jgi:hypothetical protein
MLGLRLARAILMQDGRLVWMLAFVGHATAAESCLLYYCIRDGCNGAQMEAHPPHEPTRDVAVKCAVCTPSSKNLEMDVMTWKAKSHLKFSTSLANY